MTKIDLKSLVVKKVKAVNYIKKTTKDMYTRRNREMWAISIKLSGVTKYESNGCTYISDPGHIVILPKGVSYTISFLELGECYMIEFELINEPECAGIQSYSAKNKLDLLNKITHLEHLWTFRKPAYELKCISGLYGILARMAETEMTPYQLSSKYSLIEASIDYLEKHYADNDISNEMLAEISGISTVYMRKIFCSIYNTSPMRYLQMIRIEKAKDLLRSDFSSVSEVAEAVGFESIYHFSKTFKKVTGRTPTEFAHSVSK